MKLLNLRNPVTGDFVIPAPRAGGQVIGNDITAGPSVGGNPFIRQRNVVPAEFTQDQYTLKLDGQLTHEQPTQRDGFLREVSRPRSVPGSVQPGVAVHAEARRSQRHGRALRHADLGPNKVNEVRGGMFYLNNTRQLDDPFLDLTNRGVGVDNPAKFYDASIATTRLGHYVGRPAARWSASRSAVRTTASTSGSSGPGPSATRSAGRLASHALRIGGEVRRNEFDTNLPEEQATEFEKFDNFTHAAPRAGDRSRYPVRDHRQAVPLQRLQHVLRRRLAGVAVADVELGVRYEFFGLPEEVNGRIGNVDFEAHHEHRESRQRLHRPEERPEHGIRGRSMRAIAHLAKARATTTR